MATIVPPPQLHNIGADIANIMQMAGQKKNIELEQRKVALAESMAGAQKEALLAGVNLDNQRTKTMALSTKQARKEFKDKRKLMAATFQSNVDLSVANVENKKAATQLDFARLEMVKAQTDILNNSEMTANLQTQFEMTDASVKNAQGQYTQALLAGNQESADKWAIQHQTSINAGVGLINEMGRITGIDPKVTGNASNLYGTTMLNDFQTEPTNLQIAKSTAITQSGGTGQGAALAGVFGEEGGTGLSELGDKPQASSTFTFVDTISALDKIDSIEDDKLRNKAKAAFATQETGEINAVVPGHKRGKAGIFSGEADFKEEILSKSEYLAEANRLLEEVDAETDNKKKEAKQKNLDAWLQSANKFGIKATAEAIQAELGN